MLCGNFGGLESLDWNSAGDGERAEKIGRSGAEKFQSVRLPSQFSIRKPGEGEKQKFYRTGAVTANAFGCSGTAADQENAAHYPELYRRLDYYLVRTT
jgi:hypothetical protein